MFLLSFVLLFVCVLIPAEASSVEEVSTTHQYTQKNTDEHFLKTPATCIDRAVYYYSCVCGCGGVSPTGETFVDEEGELLAHKFTEEYPGAAYFVSAATCTQRALYYKSCVCSTPGKETFEFGNLAAHVFDKEVVAEKYKDTSVTVSCSQKAVYYKSCVCGEKSNELKFEYGNTLEHNWEKKRDRFVCAECGAINENEFPDTKLDPIISAVVIGVVILSAFLVVFLPKVIKVKRKW